LAIVQRLTQSLPALTPACRAAVDTAWIASVPPPEEALARLDYIWDNYFQYNVAPTEAPSEVKSIATAAAK
jgi:hypothetical protein